MPYKYPKGTKIYLCQHEEENKKKDKDHQSYYSAWAGDKVRFEFCRLCGTMFLGLLTRKALKELVERVAQTAIREDD